MDELKTKRERDYHPHHTLLGAAFTNLELAEAEEAGSHYFELAAILFSGLAVEAVANSFGERYVNNWKDYESSSPMAKIQIVASTLQVEFNDEKQPWCHLRWLVKFRNRIAHAKPEMIKLESTMSQAEWQSSRKKPPPSKIEAEINIKNAQRSVAAAYQIRDLLAECIPDDEFNHLRNDGWTEESGKIPESANKTQHHKSDRAGGSEA